VEHREIATTSAPRGDGDVVEVESFSSPVLAAKRFRCWFKRATK
jgi:hypothetical protein